MDKIERCVSDVVAIANGPRRIMSRQRRALRSCSTTSRPAFQRRAEATRSTPRGL